MRNIGYLLSGLLLAAFACHNATASELEAVERHYVAAPPAPSFQTSQDADAKSAGCISCHSKSDAKSMHASSSVVLGCTDCHGGNAAVFGPAGEEFHARSAIGPRNPLTLTEEEEHERGEPHTHWSPAYLGALEQAHVLPRFPTRWSWPASRTPESSYSRLNDESDEFIRFINPGDLRVAKEACGACHQPIVRASQTSLMATSAMLWGGASYNNGILPFKRYILGEYYAKDSEHGAISNPTEVTPEMAKRGILPKLYPLPAWETVPPADIFRVFERGGRNINSTFPEIGLPNSLGLIQRLEEPGRPDIHQSNRGPGTGQRVAIPVLNVTKTRLNDPHLWFMGTSDNPGDFRSSGCSGCHVVYANDRDPRHSGPYAQFGNEGFSQQSDPTIPANEPGHPLQHSFTRRIPTSNCMSCHMHQPNMFINTMLGYIMWDYETDADRMWPKQQFNPTDRQTRLINDRNPEEAAIRGKWADPEFLKNVALMNPELRDTQFADYHGHGWNFRAIFKRDRKGDLLDGDGKIVSNDDPKKFEKAVHMSSIHIDVGMHCVDCHFSQDAHSSGNIVGEVMAGVEVQCQDCHGTADNYPTLRTSGVMASKYGRDLTLIRNPDGKKRFEWVDGKLIQRSLVNEGMEWTITLLKDTSDKKSPAYNALADRSHTMSMNTRTLEFGADVPKDQRAHSEDKMMCYTCHTSWTTSCGGCHLPIQANWKTERHHYESTESRNFATYNPQVARDDMFQIGIHGEIKGGKIAPVRSTSALVLSSTNINRERIYIQQPPIAASGYSSQAFAPHYPHTERRTETKQCTDCHLSKNNDNNAIMTQLLLQGTKFVDLLGYNAWVGGEGEVTAVPVTEWDEPQAVLGSYLQKFAYPDHFDTLQKNNKQLPDGFSHRAGVASCIQHRGEYLYVAEGEKGTRVYDIASQANKGYSQKFVTAPFSDLGHDTHVKSKNATCAALATTQPVQPSRSRSKLMTETNLEQVMHPIYEYMFITDAEEGLILVNIDTLHNFESRDNNLSRALTWNDGGVLTGARHITVAGTWLYVSTPKGVVVLDVDDVLKPRYVTTIEVDDPRAAQVQFRYLFVTTRQGLQTVDVTHPEKPIILPGAVVALKDAHKLHVARTYAYVAAGAEGVAIIDVTKADKPQLYEMFNAGGSINDARDVTVASTNASPFLYVADGKNGLRVVQLTSPVSQPNFYGYAAEPKPELIASYPTKRAALALSRALERDRAVDETGHQVAVLGRIGARPFNAKEMARLYLDQGGEPWFVDDAVSGPKGIATKPTPWKNNRTWQAQQPTMQLDPNVNIATQPQATPASSQRPGLQVGTMSTRPGAGNKKN